MSDKQASLDRIEKTLEAVCGELQTLRGQVDSLVSASDGTAPSKEEVIQFLDGFRAGEALGEASLGAWIEVSDLACVKGGLRTVQQREGFHARLLEARVKELGGTCTAEIPQEAYDAAMKQSADSKKTDAEKVLDFAQRFPEPEAALKPIHDLADRLDADPETQSLLRTIAQDECSTLTWFQETCAQLNG
jgi:hypothetical protein